MRLEPLTSAHGSDLFDALAEERLWTYLPVEVPTSVEEFAELIEDQCAKSDALPFAVIDGQGRAVGMLSYLRIQPEIGSIEVGWVTFGPALQRSRSSTEAQYLLMHHAFEELGYRRYEWKCDSLNAASRRAAERLGFREEGTWRNAMVLKGRNRDTTWFSITREEWPSIRAGFEAWLAPANFDADGGQLRSLEAWISQECGRAGS